MLSKDFIILENPDTYPIDVYPYKSENLIATFCENGSAHGTINMREYKVDKGGFILILPGQIIESTEVSNDFEGKIIMMSEKFTDSLDISGSFRLTSSVEQQQYFLFPTEIADSIRSYIDMCDKMINIVEDEHLQTEVLRLLSVAFFKGIGSMVIGREESHAESRGEQITSRFLSLVEQNYLEHRDLKFYADRMCLSPKYISLAIKAESGRTATEWIERYVLLEAKAQLLTSRYNISQVSEMLGFPTLASFSKYFKRLTGLSPKDFRAQAR